MVEFIDNNMPSSGMGGGGGGGDGACIYAADVDTHDFDAENVSHSHNHLLPMDTPLLLSEDEFGTRSHKVRQLEGNFDKCTVADQGFGRSDDDTNSGSTAKLQLIMAIALCLIFMVAEIIGGYMAGSLAIMADAAHLLTDCISFIVSLVAIWMSGRPPDRRMTFGYKRVEVLGAIMSIFGIWLLTAFLCYFSIDRLVHTDFDIDAHTMMLISAIGIGINVIMAFILHGSCNIPHGHTHSHGHGHSHAHSTAGHSQTQYSRLKSPVGIIDANGSSSNGAADLEPTTAATFVIINGAIPSHLHSGGVTRSDSICSYRSPGHSRTSSFGTARPNGAGVAASPLHHANALNTRLQEAAAAARSKALSTTANGVANGHAYGGSSSHERRRPSDERDVRLPAKRTNINLQAAVIHVIGDFKQSVGVFVAAVVINYYPDAKLVDPLCTVLFSVIVLFTTVRLMRQSLSVMMDAVPSDVDVRRLASELGSLSGVRSVHDLTVWSVSVDWPVMAVHLVVDPSCRAAKVVSNATEMAREEFGIRHSTIQLEHHQQSGGHFHHGHHLLDTLHHTQTPEQRIVDGPNGDAMIQFV